MSFLQSLQYKAQAFYNKIQNLVQSPVRGNSIKNFFKICLLLGVTIAISVVIFYVVWALIVYIFALIVAIWLVMWVLNKFNALRVRNQTVFEENENAHPESPHPTKNIKAKVWE